MLNEKRVKAMILVGLFLIEGFVWIVNGPNNIWSLGFSDGTEGQISEELPGDEQGGKGQDRPGGQEGRPGDDPAGQPGDDPGDQPGQGPEQSDGEREKALREAEQKGLLILVNKSHPIDRDYKPDDLEKIRYYAPDRSEGARYMRAEAADAFHQLVDKAALEGLEIKMTTAYRSYDFQKILYDNYVAREGEAAANTYSAKPGQSEHQTGLSVDVSSPSVGYQLSNEYGETPEGRWLAEHAHEFGFIIRFPKGKEDITGYQYEPWHIRYVGAAAAGEIYENNLTLEEFLEDNESIFKAENN